MNQRAENAHLNRPNHNGSGRRLLHFIRDFPKVLSTNIETSYRMIRRLNNFVNKVFQMLIRSELPSTLTAYLFWKAADSRRGKHNVTIANGESERVQFSLFEIGTFADLNRNPKWLASSNDVEINHRIDRCHTY